MVSPKMSSTEALLVYPYWAKQGFEKPFPCDNNNNVSLLVRDHSH